jgi:cell division protein FtsB
VIKGIQKVEKHVADRFADLEHRISSAFQSQAKESESLDRWHADQERQLASVQASSAKLFREMEELRNGSTFNALYTP